jgi:hypothetical protein
MLPTAIDGQPSFIFEWDLRRFARLRYIVFRELAKSVKLIWLRRNPYWLVLELPFSTGISLLA